MDEDTTEVDELAALCCLARQSPPVRARAMTIPFFALIALGPRRAGFHAPHVAPFHQRLSVVVGTTMWFWIFYRAYHDGPVVIVRWYPRGVGWGGRDGMATERGRSYRIAPAQPLDGQLDWPRGASDADSLSGGARQGERRLCVEHSRLWQCARMRLRRSARTGAPTARRLRATPSLCHPPHDLHRFVRRYLASPMCRRLPARTLPIFARVVAGVAAAVGARRPR